MINPFKLKDIIHDWLRRPRTLLALRETGSLVEAAERVHLTQSALSHQLKDLEGRVNSPLFVRKTQTVEFLGQVYGY